MTQSFRLFKELILHLSKKELILLKKKLQLNIEVADKNKNKSKELLKLFLSNPDISSTEAGKRIYGKVHDQAFTKLVDRSIEKIDEVILSFSRENIPLYSERNYYYFYLKRKLAILQLRLLRGIDFNLGSQFNKIISLSKKYELIDILIETLYAKQRFVGFTVGKKGFGKLELEIEKAEFNRKAVLNSRRLWIDYGSKINRTTLAVEYLTEVSNSIDLLTKDYKLTKSPTIEYYLLFFQVEWFQLHRKFETAEMVLYKLLKLVETHPSLYTRARCADLLMNLSNNQILLAEFADAISNSIKAQAFCEKKSETISVAMEVEFLARFFFGEIENSEKIIEKIYLFSVTHGNSFLLSRRAYYFACIKTIKGEFGESNELLLETKELEKDKAGWNLGIRVLSIINQIELENYESAELKVLSMEKYMKRISKSNYVRKRDKAILRILLKLINENFDFKIVYKERRKYFDFLEGKDPEYTWKMLSHEMIAFHDWFKRKMKVTVKEKITI